VTIISPINETKKYHFGLTGRGTINRNRIKKDLVKFGEPTKVALVAEGLASSDPGVLSAVTAVLDTLTDEPVDERPEPHTVKSDPVVDKIVDKMYAEEPDPAERHIVDRRPMLAMAGSRKGSAKKASAYQSETTIERRWSDGTVDYACAYDGCDYTNTDRLSPSRHYANMHRKGQGRAKSPETFTAEVPDAREYHYQPRDSRVAALAEVIAQMMKEGITDPEKIAETALKWVHEQTDGATDHAAEREPMTPEEIVSRIRTLLDDGTMFALETQVREKADEVVALTRLVEAAEAKAEQARGNLRALRELVADLGEDEAS
jgi:hypothetical protein